jgi:hypothetical protein
MTNFHSTIQINSSFKHSLNSSINSSFNFSNTHRQREREIERTSPTSIRGGAGWRLSEEEVALGRCRRWGGDIIEEAACSVGALERLVWLRREWGAGGVGALRWADDVEGVGVGASARRCRCRALYRLMSGGGAGRRRVALVVTVPRRQWRHALMVERRSAGSVVEHDGEDGASAAGALCVDRRVMWGGGAVAHRGLSPQTYSSPPLADES